MEQAPRFEVKAQENLESSDAWRELQEQALTRAHSLMLEQLGAEPEALPANEVVEALKELINEYKDGNENRFLVEEFSKHLQVAQLRLSLEESMTNLFPHGMKEAA